MNMKVHCTFIQNQAFDQFYMSCLKQKKIPFHIRRTGYVENQEKELHTQHTLSNSDSIQNDKLSQQIDEISNNIQQLFNQQWNVNNKTNKNISDNIIVIKRQNNDKEEMLQLKRKLVMNYIQRQQIRLNYWEKIKDQAIQQYNKEIKHYQQLENGERSRFQMKKLPTIQYIDQKIQEIEDQIQQKIEQLFNVAQIMNNKKQLIQTIKTLQVEYLIQYKKKISKKRIQAIRKVLQIKKKKVVPWDIFSNEKIKNIIECLQQQILKWKENKPIYYFDSTILTSNFDLKAYQLPNQIAMRDQELRSKNYTHLLLIISNKNDVYYGLVNESLTIKTVHYFLERSIRNIQYQHKEEKDITVVLDNAGINKAQEIKINLMYIVPRTPQLNCVEKAFGMIKQIMMKQKRIQQQWKSIHQLQRTLQIHLSNLRTEKIKRFFIQSSVELIQLMKQSYNE